MTLHIPFDNSYARLDDRFFTKLAPTEVKAPSLIAVNRTLAHDLGLDADALTTPEGIATLAGNTVPDGADPLAQVYAGHQFGGWSPRLGDGRALLLGEIIAPDGERFDIQLKGSGPTPYSRMGDGRAWLGPVLREYIVSEAMHALGIATTRALAAVSTGDDVLRETPLPGAILTRVASSHIRVGTFQYFASQRDEDALKALTEHAIHRHYPDSDGALDFLDKVIARQAGLVAKWMGVGFVHGVMNTDNMAVSGETIDYGPCAYMDHYHPMQVYSSIDRQGRYAYGRQPDMAMWNLAQLATSLLPLIGEVEAAQASLDRFPVLFRAAWLDVFRAKIGLNTRSEEDDALIQDLLNRMAHGQSDFTNTFRALGTPKARDEFVDPESYDDWERSWRNRLAQEDATSEGRVSDLVAINPALIARTHRIEQSIQAALAGDFKPFERMIGALATPFADPGEAIELARTPLEDEVIPQTFCGT